MEFLSNISPKLGWIISLGVVAVFIYIGITNWKSSVSDEKIKVNGSNITAEIVDVKYDDLQRINNHLTAAVMVKYNFKGHEVISKRGIAFPYVEKEKFKPGEHVNVRVDNENGQRFYFLEYRTF